MYTFLNKKNGLGIILIFLSMVVAGQDTKDNYLKMGKQAFHNGDIYGAIDYLTVYCEKNKEDFKACFQLAEASRLARDYEKAFYYYGLAYSKKEKLHLALFHMGKLSMNQGRYDSAMVFFHQFRRNTRFKKKFRNYRRLVYDLVEGCKIARDDTILSADYEIKHTGRGVNRKHLEYAPYPINDTLLLYITMEENVPQNQRKAKIAQIEEGKWTARGEWDPPFANHLKNINQGAFSDDRKRYYFTRQEINWQEKEICHIHVTEFKDSSWQDPVKLGYNVNHPDYSSMMVSVTTDLRTGNDLLYFSSDREGGKGGMDIWYTFWNSRENEFREPRNAGRVINTAGNEITPWYDSNSRSLWFSSDGHPGYGGYDIYRTSGFMGKWIDVEHFPLPFNSRFDDYYAAVMNQGQEGYFTSNRDGALSLENGHCCDDIFYFRRLGCFYIPLSGSVFNIPGEDLYEFLSSRFKGDFLTLLDTGYLSNVPVQLYLDSEDEEILLKTDYTDDKGNFRFSLEKGKDYFVLIKNYGYFDKRIPIRTQELDCGDTLSLRSTGISYIPELTMRFNIYYEFDRARLTSEARLKIDTTLLGLFGLFPNAIIEIGSHTDNLGSENYNQKLSQRRSEGVVRYLIERGISVERLIAKGYGESVPVAPNSNPDGTDNPGGRQLNRRTEIKIVGQINAFYDEF
ncbi:MAG: OmpA family protein [Bacteroidales bacterium]